MFKNLNWKLIIIVLILLLIGELAVYSASSIRHNSDGLIFKQTLWIFLGISILIFVAAFGYNWMLEIAYPLYFLIVLLLVLVDIFGVKRLGAQRWLYLGCFNIQPSELAKFVLILTLARFFGSEKQRVSNFNTIFVSMVIIFLPFMLVLLQPDLGTALSFVPFFVVMIFVAGINIKYLLSFFVLGTALSPFLWNLLKDYQKKRLLVFLNPNIDPLGAGYTIIQSKIAIGSGGLFGKGYLMGTQNQLKFLPEAHTDFIFAVMAEEWGFIGSLLISFLYFFLICESYNIALRTKNNHAKLLAAGIAAMFVFHFVINIGMTLGLVPVVGLPLPFISYGGSNLVISLAAVGILLSIDKDSAKNRLKE